MSLHYIILSIDTDPDNLNSPNPDRQSLAWDGLDFAINNFHTALEDIPLTWYIRADGQLEQTYGKVSYLLDTHADFWQKALERGDELGWHPHLYTLAQNGKQPEIITESQAAVTELQHIWELIKDYALALTSFRMGEAWHSTETFNLIESLGFKVDSTAIPNRDDSVMGHPRNWKDSPNQPYYPQEKDTRLEGQKRLMLEVPMNSWCFQASYDKSPKLRYMNPCVHADLWLQGLDYWEAYVQQNPAEIYLWTLILHPSEAMPKAEADLLYAHSLDVLAANLEAFAAKISSRGDEYQFTTVCNAAEIWRNHS